MSERRAGLETGNAQADLPEIQGRPPFSEWDERQRSEDCAGVVALACMQEGVVGTREALVVEMRDLQPGPCERQAGPQRVAEGSVVPEKPGNAGGGKGPWFRVSVGPERAGRVA